MPQQPEPFLVDYARYHGISQNHLEINPLDLQHPPDDISAEQDDELEWQQLRTAASSPPPERFVAVKEASVLLAATNAKQYEGCQFEGYDVTPVYRMRNLKLELPLLRSDHEVDMLEFVHKIEPNLAEEFIPAETLDDELDEGLGWPSYCHELPDKVFQKAQNEKLEVAKDVLGYMKNKALDPVTPPLLPRSPSPQAYEPSSETGHLDLWTDCSSPTRQELQQIEKTLLFERDALLPTKKHVKSSGGDPARSPRDTDSLGDLYSPLRGIKRAPSPPAFKRRCAADLKVEGPLTPPPTDRPPPWDNRNVSLSTILQEVVPGLELPVPEPEQTSAEDIDKLFADQIVPIAAKAEQAIEQEQLLEADTTSRVPVPVMDFSRPMPPWKDFSIANDSETQQEFLRNIKETYLNLPTWRLDGHIMRELSWVPFSSSLGRFELQESIEDDDSLTAFISQPEAIDANALVWKRPGLRILDDVWDSDEEELEYGSFPEAKDVRSLIKKRNFELQDGGNDLAIDAENMSSKHPATRRRIQSADSTFHQHRDQAEVPIDDHNAIGANFSAMGALDEFLGVRKGEFTKKVQPAEHLPRAPIPNAPTGSHKTQEPVEPHVSKRVLTLPTPQLDLPSTPRFFVASTTFLANRKLVRQIQDLYPSAQLVERDFILHNLPPEPQSKIARSTPSISDEADLILSPSTGLVITSLQKVKQQALPGQATRSPIRERLEQVAARYGRLVVIIDRTAASSVNDASLINGLDESDCEALISFTTFLNHLPGLGESELILVEGDTSCLATWIISLMIKYSSDTAVNLLQEETQWEVFLRQAGMNAFAAQVVLAEMKAVQERDGSVWGLRQFVLMSPKERYRRFEILLGGRAMLEKVGQVLDARW
ncbi:MAG: hypothetical protein Q9218_001761 [Villophora microphyllina]